VKRKPRDFRN